MVFSDFRNLWKNRPKSGILVRMEATDHRPKFARRRLDVRVCMGLLALLTLAGNFRELRSFGEAHEYLHRTWDGHPFRGTTLLADGPRRVLERHDVPGGIFLLLSNPRQGMLPFERTMHHALSWSQSPRPVRFGSLADVREEDAIVRLFATNSPDFAEAGLDSRGFRLGGSEHGAEVWLSDRVRPRAGAHEARFPAPGMLREALGMLPLLLAIAIGCWRGRGAGAAWATLLFSLAMLFPPLLGFRPSPAYVWLAAAGCAAVLVYSLNHEIHETHEKSPESNPSKNASGGLCTGTCRKTGFRVGASNGIALGYGILAAALALCHTFFAPNGLAVQGGRAKALFLSGGIPDGFFTDAAWRPLLAAYPPGLSLLTLGCYGAAGGCGEYLTQLLGVFAMAALLRHLQLRAPFPAWRLWILSLFLTPTALSLATQYYAEPFMLLFLVLGMEQAQSKPERVLPWILAGAAGWFKMEGLALFSLWWLARRALRGRSAAPWAGLVAGAALPVAWHVGCRLAGGALPDMAPFWEPSLGHAAAAASRMLRAAFLRPWETAFAFPLALAATGWPLLSRRKPGEPARLRESSALLLDGLAVIPALYACSLAPDFPWHVESSVGRLLFAVAAMAAAAFPETANA